MALLLLLILALFWQAEHICAFCHHPLFFRSSSLLTSVSRTIHQHQHPDNRQQPQLQTAAQKEQQQQRQNQFISRWQRGAFLSSSSSGDDSPSPPQEQSNNNKPSVAAPPPPPPPMFNGKRVLPGSIVQAGLKASLPSRVVAVYAILVGGSALEKIVHVGVTQDLYATLQAFTQTTQQTISHVRAQSFSSTTTTTTENDDGAAQVFLTPEQHLAMQDICQDWKQQAVQATGQELSEWTDPSAYLFSNDDDDEDEDDEEDDYDDYDDLDEDEKEIVDLFSQPGFQFRSSTPNSNSPPPAVSSAKTTTTKDPEPSEPQEEEEKEIISPFATTTTTTTTTAVSTTSSSGGGANVLVFTTETVNQALDEIRPYLIADGGNVAVAGVDPDRWLVQLELQGACGSCPSSTVTMQMGIERVLKEQFGPNVVVEQVTPATTAGGDGSEGEGVEAAAALFQAVEQELSRLSQAVIAMGGVVRIVSMDAETGVVQLNFRGSTKLQQGLELALQDVQGVNAVQFVSSE